MSLKYIKIEDMLVRVLLYHQCLNNLWEFLLQKCVDTQDGPVCMQSLLSGDDKCAVLTSKWA